jgi:hypothetical protein
MMKWIFGLLLLVNVVFFAVMQWGHALTVDASNPPAQAELNADKIKIVGLNVAVPAEPASVASSVPEAVIPPVDSVAPPEEVTPEPPVVVVPPHPKLICMEWGEFSGADLQRAEKALATMRLGDKLKQRIVEYASGYWVYLSPTRSVEQVKNKIALLKSLDINDYFVVQESGPWKNAISLGVFKTEESAQKYLVNVEALGLRGAKVDERPSKLKFVVFVLNRLESNASSQILALHKEFPESEIKHVPCN